MDQLARLLARPMPAWALLVVLLLVALVELARSRTRREAPPDLHAEFLEFSRELLKSNSANVAALVEVSKRPEPEG